VDSRENRNVRNYDLVGFSEGSTELSNDFKDLVTTLSERKVVITGYADKEEADPIAVSLNRAQVVKDYLIGKGWNEANITIKANGATDQFDKKNLAPNRRVYIQGDWPLD
jgi:outer membrane protein OmpA-like peptidoglycan-associated protein